MLLLSVCSVASCSSSDNGGSATNNPVGTPVAGQAAAGVSGSAGTKASSGSNAGATGAAGHANAAAGASAGASGTGAAGMTAIDDDAGVSPPKSDGTHPNAVNPYPGYQSPIYGDDKLWMCKPGLQKNYCLEDIADATEALPDGTFKPFMDSLSDDHPIDCLFWYPTVNRSEDPKSLDFSNPEPMLSSIRGQAARFSRVCNVYAPFYRQVSLNNGGDSMLAYQDVVDGFKHYIANWNKGRYFVIFGHSQGTGHATKLISEEVNDNPDLRERMVSALLIGGGLTPTTFSNIPLCTKPDQFNCAIGYRSYGEPNPPKGTAIPANLACTNPGALGGGPAVMKGSFFQSAGSDYAPPLGPDFTAHFGLFRGLFTAECKPAPQGGGQYLEVKYTDAPGDMRKHFLDLSKEIAFGTHVFDYDYPTDDLIELVRSQSEAMMKAKP
jgi:hypothetical protein